MTKRSLFQSFVVAASVLAAAGSAHAQIKTDGTTYDYATFWDVPSAPGSLQISDKNLTSPNLGGLCAIGSGACSGLSDIGGNTLGTLYSGGTTSGAGLIEIQTPQAMANYLLSLTITGISQNTGDIYNIVVNGSSLGITSLTPYNVGGSTGFFTTVVSGGNNAPIFISVTDLLQQYLGSSNYDLPSLEGGPSSFNQPLGLGKCTASNQATCFDGSSQFTLTATLVPDPEPASLSIFALGSLALGAARRRRHAKANKTAA